jgi:hypothetical protein
MEAVTIGPIPRSMIEPDAPAKNALYDSKRSIDSAESPNKGTFVSAK